MKKNTNLALVAALIVAFSISSCKNNEQHISEENITTEVKSEDNINKIEGLNTIIADPENEGEKMLLGLINEKGLNSDVKFPWMNEGFEEYQPNAPKIMEIKKLMSGITLQVFMGTWCEDSQREIPRLYKILNSIDYKMANMQMVAVSNDKDTPKGHEKGFNLEYVPTIIFMKDGKELNRIVEYTKGDRLEDDIITILKKEDYTPAYAE